MKDLMLYLFNSLPALIAAFLGTLGFAIIFKLKGKYLVYISVCGFFNYAIYIIALFFNWSEFWASAVATVFVAVAAEILARILKTPTVIFTLPGVVPIVPGSTLYYSVRYLLLRDYENFAVSFKSTCYIALGIVCGTVVVSVIIRFVCGCVSSCMLKSRKGCTDIDGTEKNVKKSNKMFD